MPSPANSTEIRWTTKSNSTEPHERILEVGVPTLDGTCRKIPHAEAVRMQRDDITVFCVKVNGQIVYTTVAEAKGGERYLKSLADGDQPDILLDLPDCP
jgi:hypothetical protein